MPDLPEDWRRVASVRLREGMQASLCLSAERPTHPHLAGLRCAGIDTRFDVLCERERGVDVDLTSTGNGVGPLGMLSEPYLDR